MPRPLLILTALRYEANAIAKRLGLRWIRGPGPARAWGDGVELRVVGPRCAKLAEVEPPEGCRGIIMAGLAGAVDPSLRVGDVVADERSDMEVPRGLGRRGAIHTAVGIVATAAAKASVFAATGALVVDMENEFARAFATGCGVPFLGIRAVSDAAGQAVDPGTLDWVDEFGAVRTGRITAAICRSPSKVPALLRLGIHSRLAVRRLGDAVARAAAYPPGAAVTCAGDDAPCGSAA